MTRYIIYLIGYPGTGKKTIAKALLEQAKDLDIRLLDNHVMNNPVFTVVREQDQPIPAAAWKAVDQIWDIVFDQIRHHAPKERSFILTNHLLAGDPVDEGFFKEVQSFAEEIESVFVPICLACDMDEWEQRLQNPQRERDLKLTDLEIGRDIRDGSQVIDVDHPNHLQLDVTNLTGEAAAAEILLHLQEKARKSTRT